MTRIISLLCTVVLAGGLLPMAACLTAEDPAVEETGEANDDLGGVPIGDAPGGVFTANCQAACNNADVVCGTVLDPLTDQICCCIGMCPAWGPTCAAGVTNETIGPGESPGGGGVYTASCEASCNGANVTCGTVAAPNGQTCCCIGTCPTWGSTCADLVNSGEIGPGVAPAPGGGFYTVGCETACNGAGVTCGTVMNAAGQTCCCIGSCPQNANACAMGVLNGQAQVEVLF